MEKLNKVKINCPNCNCETFDKEPEDGVLREGLRFCSECWELVVPCEAGKGQVFLSRIRQKEEQNNGI